MPGQFGGYRTACATATGRSAAATPNEPAAPASSVRLPMCELLPELVIVSHVLFVGTPFLGWHAAQHANAG
jgi:hypothetical protein